MEKYKAWHKEAELMIEDENYVGEVYNWLHQGQPLMICRPTGTKDHNGKDAYEHDIAMHENHVDCVIVYDTKQAKYKLCPIDAYKINSGNGGFTGYELRSEQFEIIGSMYEHPKYLELD